MIEDAARRRRNRQQATFALLAAAALAAVIIGSVVGHRRISRPRPASGVTATSPDVFVQDPYMGVACRSPNSIGCDRVGLSVWLARPAIVTATIAGAPLRLDAPGWTYVARQGGKRLYVYAGFLEPAGLTTRLHVVPTVGDRWLGAPAPSPLVRFRIDYGNGKIVVTQERVFLSAGWG